MRPNVVPLSDVVGVVREEIEGGGMLREDGGRSRDEGVRLAEEGARLRFSRAQEDTRGVEARARVN